MAHVKKSYFEEVRARCLSSGTFYEDPAFPATAKSVYFSKTTSSIKWRRPTVGCMALLHRLLLIVVAAAAAPVKIS